MMRYTRNVAFLLLAALVPGLALGAFTLPEPREVVRGVLDAAKEQHLTIHFLDVGQGDAALIISPERRAVLVDGGPRSGGPKVLDLMRREGIGALDLVIASHPHLDHIGGIQPVLETVPVRYYMDPGVAHGSRAYERLLQTLESLEIPVLTARAGRTINLGGGATLEVLAPEEPLHQGTRSDVNANSAVVRLEQEGFSILLTGDAEAETEQRLAVLPNVQSTVLKVPHHGGRHSSTRELLAAAAPEVAVIQVGATNAYGHPHPDTLERLEAAGARIYRNDLHGTVTIIFDGETYTVSTERRPAIEPADAQTRRAGEGDSGRAQGPPSPP